jgi:hypothetical protein
LSSCRLERGAGVGAGVEVLLRPSLPLPLLSLPEVEPDASLWSSSWRFGRPEDGLVGLVGTDVDWRLGVYAGVSAGAGVATAATAEVTGAAGAAAVGASAVC